MKYGFQIRHLIAYDDFRGTEASAIDFGFEEERIERRQAGGPQFSVIDHTDTWRDASNRIAEAGDIYSRPAEIVGYDALGDPIIQLTGVWEYRGELRTLAGRTAMRDRNAGVRMATNMSRGSASEPGANMKNPAGMQLYDELGAILKRPAVGEQDIDEWTAELLFELDGVTPVLVPAP